MIDDDGYYRAYNGKRYYWDDEFGGWFEAVNKEELTHFDRYGLFYILGFSVILSLLIAY